MNDKLPCEVVRDLLPSYVDGLTCETTDRLVGEHIEGCGACRAALDAMRAPSAEPDGRAEREIDYLKRNRRHNRRVVLLSLAGALLLAFAILLARLFAVGEALNAAAVPRELTVEGNRLSAQMDCMDSARVVTKVDFTEENGVVTLHPRGVLASFLHPRSVRVDYEAAEPIRRVCLAERILWDDGAPIPQPVSALYATRHDYVGDMPANGRTAIALELMRRIGPYDNELRTSQRPYVWTLRLQSAFTAAEWERLAPELQSSARILLALIGNLDEVRFTAEADGAAVELSVTADDAAAFFGRSVKDCAASPRLLAELCAASGLSF